MQGDVYPVEQASDLMVHRVLDAHWGLLTEEDVSELVARLDICRFY